jgi:hypothetical protein
MGCAIGVEVPKMVFVGDKRLFVLQCVLHVCFGLAAIAQIFALNSWANFKRPLSTLSMWSDGGFPLLETVSADKCGLLARGLRGMKECLKPPYFNNTEQRWRQDVNDYTTSNGCREYLNYQGEVQTYWQNDSKITCMPYYPPRGKATNADTMTFITAAQVGCGF